MRISEKGQLLESGGLFKFTFKDDLRKIPNLYGRVVRVTTNGTKSQLYAKIKDEALLEIKGKDDGGNVIMKQRGTHQLSYNGLLNLKNLHDIEKVKD